MRGVDDLAFRRLQGGAALCRFGAGGQKRQQPVDDGAGGFRSACKPCSLCVRLQRLHGGEAEEAGKLPSRQRENGEDADGDGADGRIAEPVGAAEEIADQLVCPQAERQRQEDAEGAGGKLAERKPFSARFRHDEARGLVRRFFGQEGIEFVRRHDDGLVETLRTAPQRRRCDGRRFRLFFFDTEGGGLAGGRPVGFLRFGRSHAKRSPKRNCRARSRRMCGTDSFMPAPLSSTAGGRKRTTLRSGRWCSESDSSA